MVICVPLLLFNYQMDNRDVIRDALNILCLVMLDNKQRLTGAIING